MAPRLTVQTSDPFASRLLQALAPAVADGKGARRPLSVVDRRVTGRSRLYFLSDGVPGAGLVAKVPLTQAPSDHPPLDAMAQFDALRRSHGWFREDDRHAVAEPVACLPELGALVMRHAAGPTVAEVLARGLRDPEAALRAVVAAGDFLRRFHAHGAAGDGDLDLREVAEALQEEASEVLRPLRLRPPSRLCRRLSDVPQRSIRVRRVLRHGDYVGANLIVTGPNRLTMIDPSLSEVGLPEDDLARFLAHLSSTTIFMAGAAWPPALKLRRRLEQRFLDAYGPLPNGPAVLELRLIRQHTLRWARRTELAAARVRGPRLAAQRLVIGRHARRLLREASARLAQALRRRSGANGVGWP